MNRKGFTLVELAIVLVIIGLILGAVFKGKDLINSAKGKSYANKLRAIEIAEATYYDKNQTPATTTEELKTIDGITDATFKIGDANINITDNSTEFEGVGNMTSNNTNICAYFDAGTGNATVSGTVLEFMDRAIDDGNVSSGYFAQKSGNTTVYYKIW
ncbi:prepilin-type N-terminal cleavage/methylation domain-containing protein [Candidatus Aerophobetes bacterium]|nr:prepilin-type N-terminal cleavage/methylation domain-containing protein [Candidatus Aerophobetes bacterium]